MGHVSAAIAEVQTDHGPDSITYITPGTDGVPSSWQPGTNIANG